MSRAEAVGEHGRRRARGRASATRPSPLWTFGLLRSELVTTFRRWRTLALLGVLAAVPVLVGIAVKIETSDGSSAGGGGGRRARRSSRRSPTTACSWSSPRSPRRCRSSCRWRSASSRATRSRARPTRAPCAICWSPPPAGPGCCSPSTRPRWRSAWSRPSSWRPRRSPSGRCCSRSARSRRSPARGSASARGWCGPLLIALVVAASLIGIAALGLFVSTLTEQRHRGDGDDRRPADHRADPRPDPPAARDPAVLLLALLAVLRRPACATRSTGTTW